MMRGAEPPAPAVFAGPFARARACLRGRAGEEGQMVVEMAVLTPVMLVVAVVVLNLMWFLEAAARFDRVVPDTVMAVAVSPAGEEGGGAHEHEVTVALTEAMDGLRGVTVTVQAQIVWDDLSDGAGFTMAPHLTRYVCTMAYTPWPSGFSVAGFDAAVPVELKHVRSFVVDRYRSGVVF